MESSDLIFLIGLPGLLVSLALGTIVALMIRKARLVRELRADEAFLAALRDSEDGSGLVSATREHIVPSPIPDKGRYVLSKSLASVRREYAEDEIAHHWAFSVGGMLTGLALLLTFILIGYVMTNDISGAIHQTASEDASTGNAAMTSLAGAVKTLGGKFYISAAGIGGSVFALFFANHARNAILSVAERPSRQLIAAFTTVEEQQLNAKLHELELVRSDRETRNTHHTELVQYLASLDRRIEKLNSIEVSLKGIGLEVSANLKNIMKDAMGEQLADMLRDTMVEVEKIATRVERSVTDSFGKQMETLAVEMTKGLDMLRKAIEGQGQGQLDQILDKLSNTVSGGFQNESQKMVAALDGFAKVVPALEQQLRTMTGKVAEESRQRSEESARMTQTVMERVSSLVESLSAQQAENAQAVERMREASTQSAQEFAKRMETSGANLVSSVIGSSRTEIEAIVATMKAMMESNASRFGDIETKAANASAIVAKASDSLAESARSIHALGAQTNAMLAEAKRTADAMQAVAHQFSSAGNVLVSGVDSMQQVTEATRAQTREQYSLLQHQQEYRKQIEQLWPTLFDTYLKKFRESSEELARGWSELHAKFERATKSVGAEFAENTLTLSDAVEKLVKINGGKVATR